VASVTDSPLRDAVPEAEADVDVPRRPVDRPTRGDRVFLTIATGATSVSLVIVVTTLVFLIQKSRPAFKHSGVIGFFTHSVWNPSTGVFGVYGLLMGTIIIAVIAMFIAVPTGVAMALFINEYSPRRLRGPLTSIVDLLAALPSLLFGYWGLKALQPRLIPVSSWFGSHLSVLPFFKVSPGQGLSQSSLIAGVVVGIMAMPIIASVSRDVMSQCPREQCEGALALGGTRWGMIRSVVLPFGRSGIVGASLLGLGRALGETIAVALIISLTVQPNYHVLQLGGGSIASQIAVRFPEAGPLERSGLVAAGLALFILTLIVNLLARAVVRRNAYTAA
jgi:phosphate transport system permease protein